MLTNGGGVSEETRPSEFAGALDGVTAAPPGPPRWLAATGAQSRSSTSASAESTVVHSETRDWLTSDREDDGEEDGVAVVVDLV